MFVGKDGAKYCTSTHLCLSCLLSKTFVTGNPIDLKLHSDSSYFAACGQIHQYPCFKQYIGFPNSLAVLRYITLHLEIYPSHVL